jgi:hypothetical protein
VSLARLQAGTSQATSRGDVGLSVLRAHARDATTQSSKQLTTPRDEKALLKLQVAASPPPMRDIYSGPNEQGGWGTARQERTLDEGQLPNFRGLRVALLGTGYNAGE